MRRAAIVLPLSFLLGATVAVAADPPATPSPAPSSAAQPAAEAAAPLPSVTLPAALARVLTDYEAAWRNTDAKALAALFAEDGFVLSSGSAPVRGRAEIEKHYQGAGGPLALRAFAYGTDGALGWIVGGFAREAGQPDSGKFTLTLSKGPNGRWLINSDMDNGNHRPS
ncbi:MAG TPA: SgcJ/EcaC family oxidoreductase [Verrucomicrobiae bacterium]|nr:SgcJ/EcaC family oxidoreductase [Verrucomicrobiae bacterium]